MTARPTTPVFAAGDSSLANLQNLAASVGFLGTTPLGWHLYKAADQNLTAGITATITFGTVAFDPDSVLVGGGTATVNTKGYYDCECTLPFSNTGGAGASSRAWFQVTTGANNPLGSGVGIPFGRISDLTTGNADSMSLTFFGTTPLCLYPGDNVAVQANVGGSAVTVSHTFSNSGNNDLGGFPDGGAYFTAQWVSEGP